MTDTVTDACNVFDVVNCEFLQKKMLAILRSSNQNLSIEGFNQSTSSIMVSNGKYIARYKDSRTGRNYTVEFNITASADKG